MRIRPAEERDRAFILGLAPRLIAFGEVPGRDQAQMAERDRAVLALTLDGGSNDADLFVAEADDGMLAGFIHLSRAHDYYTDSVTAHVADVVVATEVEGQGIGRALLDFAEQWGRDQGFAMLTLNVFIANGRAREVYRKLGFREEWIRCIKRL